MTRTERNEYNEIRRSLKGRTPGYGSQLTIRTDRGVEYKQALHAFYTGLDFHPASVRTDSRFFDENERIIYIKGVEEDGFHWTELYTKEEQARFEAKLH